MHLKAAHLEKCFYSPDKIEVLKDVNLDLPPGATVSLRGESGSGKSTLLNCLGLLDEVDEGLIEIDGVKVSSMNDQEKSRFRLEQMAFVFQFHHLIPELSVLQNVLLPGTLRGVEDKKKAYHLLEEVGLVDKARNFPWQLSGGEAQRVAIARALLNDPKFLLTDEATGNLDPERAQSVIELLFDLVKKRNATLISVTHDEGLAQQYKFQYRLKNGQLWDCVGKS